MPPPSVPPIAIDCVPAALAFDPTTTALVPPEVLSPHSTLSVPVQAAIVGILIPAATNPALKALNFNNRIPPVAVFALLFLLELTTVLDDLPRLFAYSATAIKQFKDAFHITL